MKELRDWLGRVGAIQPTPDEPATVQMRRVLAPSVLQFDESIIRCKGTGITHFPVGSDPAQLSVLVWPDEGTDLFRDHVVASEFGALLTLLSNRRVEVAASDVMVTEQGSQRFFLPTAQLPDRSLCGPVEIDLKAESEQYLGRILSLSADNQDAIGSATNLHYASVLLHAVDVNAAYALAVGGIERLSRAYGNVGLRWSDWAESDRFDRVFDELALDEGQRERLRDEMLADRQLRLRQTLATYVIDTLPGDFWHGSIEQFLPQWKVVWGSDWEFLGVAAGPSLPIEGLVDREPRTLRRRLLASYDARSSYVHAGRRDVDMRQVTAERTGKAPGSGPIDYAVVRAMLRALILIEFNSRSEARDLPDVRLADETLDPDPTPRYRPMADRPQRPVQGVGTPSRNQPCHCGSGKKYKRCHGR